MKNLKRLTGDERIVDHMESEYLGAESINQDECAEPVLTIDSLWHGEVVLDKGRKEHKTVVAFCEQSVAGIKNVKPMIINSTNRKALKKMYGNDSAKVLEGKAIQLYIDPKVRNPSTGELGDALRIKPQAPIINSAVPACSDCGEKIKDYQGVTAAKLAAATAKKYSRPLCYECSVAAKAKTDPLGGEQLAINP